MVTIDREGSHCHLSLSLSLFLSFSLSLFLSLYKLIHCHLILIIIKRVACRDFILFYLSPSVPFISLYSVIKREISHLIERVKTQGAEEKTSLLSFLCCCRCEQLSSSYSYESRHITFIQISLTSSVSELNLME